VLMRGTEGEPVADARRQPRLEVHRAGVLDTTLSVAPQEGVLVELPVLPAAIDAETTAAHIRAVLDGAVAVPAPIARQVQCLCATVRSLGTAART